LEGYNLVLEHEKIPVITFPTEWSFSMFKDSALLVIKVNKILSRYGYETKDAHGFNILFDYCYPKFIDFGSFGKKSTKKFWRGYNDFRVYYLNTLKLWSCGSSFIARKLINSGRFENGDYEFFIYKHPVARLLPQNLLLKYYFYKKHLKNLPAIDVDNILIVKRPKLKRKILKMLLTLNNRGLAPNNNINFNRLEKKINKIKKPSVHTRWGKYHSDVENRNTFDPGERFDIIINLLKKYNIKEVLEIGGNQGLFSREISKFIPKVICSDYDEVAVDLMYHKAKNTNSKITAVLLDFLRPVFKNSFEAEEVAATKRFKCETVIALALTHHLILAQKISINNIFNAFAKYLTRYIFVEFMPEGVDKNPVPSWYNINWFRSNFTKYYRLLEEVPTKKDNSRILFVGEKLETTES
jgi:hypothetical protein